MKCGARVAAAMAGGYVLGRTKKMKLALAIGGWAAGKKLGSNPAEIIGKGTELIRSSPEFAKLDQQLRGRLLEAGKAAAMAAATNRLSSLTDSIGDSAERLAAGGPLRERRPDADTARRGLGRLRRGGRAEPGEEAETVDEADEATGGERSEDEEDRDEGRDEETGRDTTDESDESDDAGTSGDAEDSGTEDEAPPRPRRRRPAVTDATPPRRRATATGTARKAGTTATRKATATGRAAAGEAGRTGRGRSASGTRASGRPTRTRRGGDDG